MHTYIETYNIEIYIQKDRQTYMQRDRQDRQTNIHTDIYTDKKHTYTYPD